jgi:zinc transporter 1/2/3
MDIFSFKILSVLIIFSTGFIGGIAPLRLKLSTSRERHLHWGSAFSGGVFLGVGLLHMIPDAIDHFKIFAPYLQYPIILFVTGLAFLFILLLEKVFVGGHEGIGRLLGTRPLYPFMLALILSVHSLIAGSVLGLEDTLVESFAIFVAIFAHKSAEAFALGISLQRADLTTKRFIYIILFFALMTPVGIFLGIYLSTYFTSTVDAALESIFDALAAGTFLYVAYVEIVEEIFEKPNDLWLKFVFIILGFSMMAILAMWI